MRDKIGLFLVLLLAAAVAHAASVPPLTVSPGNTGRVTSIADRCPTFSWSGVAGAQGYELVVYRVGAEGAAVETLRQEFRGAVHSWTPALARCLAPGERYAWSVRSLHASGPSDWSAPALLEVVAAGEAEFLEALAVVRRYLEEHPGTAPPSEAPDSPVTPPGLRAENAPSPRAPAAPEFTVSGGVVAASFTGEGSTLTELDPANLSAGTAAIDISGTATTASNLAGGASVSVSELEFDPATQAEHDAHAGAADAHREHATLEESAEIDTDIATHAGLPNVHHTPTVDTDTVLSEAQVEDYVTDGPLDMGNNPITNIGAAGTDFTATGGLRIADDLRIDGDLGIGTDPVPTTNAHIYLYDGGIFSGPYIEISGHNRARVRLERRRTDGGWYQLDTGCDTVNCANDFQITHSSAGSCLAIRDGCDVDIPTLEVETFKLNVTDSPGACDGTAEGRLYYDASLDEPCFCNGTSWSQFDGGGAC